MISNFQNQTLISTKFKTNLFLKNIKHNRKEVTYSDNYSTTHYSEHEKYLNLNKILVGRPGGNLYLEEGEHSYPFEFHLPENLPSSFEHHIGQIRYSIRGIIETSQFFSGDKCTIKPFAVKNSIDLNKLSPSLREPMEVYDSKNVIFSLGGQIQARLRVEKCCFVPGETIRFTASINNRSNRRVIRTSVKLVQDLSFFGTYKFIFKNSLTKHDYRDVARIVINKEIEAHESQEVFTFEPLVIPPVIPSQNSSNIIRINYLLVFTFGVRGSIDKNLIIPITIGTVPLLVSSQGHDLSNFSSPGYGQSISGW